MSWGQKTKKHIYTGQVEKWQRRDKLMLWIPLVYPIVMAALDLPGTVKDLTTPGMEPKEVLFLLGIYALLSCCTSIPLMLICRAVSGTAKKAAIRNATFRVTEDFDYYREKLSGFSPTAISMLMDLDVEPEKDITASVLRFTLMGVLSPDGKVIDRNKPGLQSSDQILLDGLEQGGLTKAAVSQWKNASVNEIIESGHIVRIEPKSAGRGCLFGCLQYIALIAVFAFIGMSPVMDWLDSIYESLVIMSENMGDDTLESTRYLLSEYKLLSRVLFFIFSMGTLVMYWVALPIITIVRFGTTVKHVKLFKRTPQGDVATERISGMKNFLHDFSNLSEAQKEQLILWDDFLVYAVVLEENRKILDEILQRKGVIYREVEFIK